MFYKKTKTSYRGSCKVCLNNQTKIWVQNNPERRKEIATKWDNANKESRSAYSKTYREKQPEKALLAAAKNRAQKFGLLFDLEQSDILIPETCPVFGWPLVINSGQAGGTFNSPSLDRIDSSKGYVKGNVQVLSNLANTMKNNASKEELQMFAKWILNNE